MQQEGPVDDLPIEGAMVPRLALTAQLGERLSRPLGVQVAAQLGEDRTDLDHCPAVRGGEVDLLAIGHDADPPGAYWKSE